MELILGNIDIFEYKTKLIIISITLIRFLKNYSQLNFNYNINRIYIRTYLIRTHFIKYKLKK